MQYCISKENILNGKNKILIEDKEHKGAVRVAGWLAGDMEAVFGAKPSICTIQSAKADEGLCDGTMPVIVTSVDTGDLADKLEKDGVADLSNLRKKRESYIFKLVNMHACEGQNGVNTALAVIGSDKRGTIYGMLHLSELLGVSPFIDWLDVKPVHRDEMTFDETVNMESKEPSVRYRGFFINDEWPAFGNWCNKRFGGFNAKCYEHVFELLLRLKGNYMWPAMWSAIFPQDGPDLLNAELADELGVVMGMSHHEPCLRQGEEYKYLRGPESIYGDAWDFRKNKEGITRFWEDGLKRGGHLENVITVGMRGEFDSTILGKEATLGDNIDLIRDVLKTQNELIRKYVNSDIEKVPRMIALYKEVEAFYYGDDTYKGLQGDPELDGVILMLCDDNFGNLRTVPKESERDHKGGYGMYYHMDYHGWPISYEWVNSSYLPKVWEQMSAAYEFGIRDLWIVNVGDIFTTEYPLSFFLELAYDYEKWGATNLNAPSEYTKKFVRTQFPTLSAEDAKSTEELLTGYSHIASNRRPEAMNVDVYDPVWYGESEELIDECDRYMSIAKKLYKECDDLSSYPFFELVYYPLMANLNVQKMWLYTGQNHALASIDAADAAAEYARKVSECMAFDRDLIDKLHTIHDGMWYGMGMSEHIGFNFWNEEECSFPVIHSAMRPDKPRIVTCIPGTDRHTEGGFWTGMTLVLDTFLRPDTSVGKIRLYSIGEGEAWYKISGDTDKLQVSVTEGKLKCGEQTEIEICLADESRKNGTDMTQVSEGAGSGCAEYVLYVETPSGKTTIRVPVNTEDYSSLKKGTYVWCGLDRKGLSSEHYPVRTAEKCAPAGFISIEAGHYIDKQDVADGTFTEIEAYGRTLSGMKAYPLVKRFTPGVDAPFLEYDVYMEDAGEYTVRAYVTPANPPYKDNLLRFGLSVGTKDMSDPEIVLVDTVAKSFGVGDDNYAWKQGVLDNIHICHADRTFAKGVNSLKIYACDPGFVLQKLVIYKKDKAPADSYLGPKETYRIC